jgi:hypothetical protein
MKVMDKLDERLEDIDKKDKARKEIWKLGLISHFSGEIIGLLGFMVIKGIVIPAVSSTISGSEESFPYDFGSVGLGIGIYAAMQVPALFLKGLSLTEYGNFHLACRYANDYKNEKQKANFTSWISRKFSGFHLYFSRNYEKYEKVLDNYIRFKEKLRLFNRDEYLEDI